MLGLRVYRNPALPQMTFSNARRALDLPPRGTKELREVALHAKLIFAMPLEWRNWQTQQTQNLPPVTRRGGSTPPSSTNVIPFESIR